jgi:hypothetical protein
VVKVSDIAVTLVMPERPPACGRCRHWKPLADRPPEGQCRRQPPRLLPPLNEWDRRSPRQRTLFPVTAAADACGEYQP